MRTDHKTCTLCGKYTHTKTVGFDTEGEELISPYFTDDHFTGFVNVLDKSIITHHSAACTCCTADVQLYDTIAEKINELHKTVSENHEHPQMTVASFWKVLFPVFVLSVLGLVASNVYLFNLISSLL